MRRATLTVAILALTAAPAAADWSPATGFGPLAPTTPLTVAPGEGRSVWAVWGETSGCRGPCIARASLPDGTIERSQLDGRWRGIGISAAGDALIVRTIRRGRSACRRGEALSRVEVLRWPSGGGRVGRPRRVGTPCDASAPAIEVAPSGRALVAWTQDHRIRVASGTVRRGLRDAGAVSARRSHTGGAQIARGVNGEVVLTYTQRGAIYAAAGGLSGRFRAPQRVGTGKGSHVAAVRPDGGALIAWTTTGAGGEVGTSGPNSLLAALRPDAGSPFGAPVTLASGTLRDLVAAAGTTGTVVGWHAEDVPSGGTSGVAFAPAGGGFEPVQAFESADTLAVDDLGTVHAASAFGSGVGTIRRTAPATWTQPSPYPGGILVRTGDGTLLAVAPGTFSTWMP